MSTQETMLVLDGVLGADPRRWLAEDVEMQDVTSAATYRGPEAVTARLRRHQELLHDAHRDGVRLTIDVGRGVAEWTLRGRVADDSDEVDMPVACAFEVEDGLVRSVRLYYDPHRLYG